MALRGQPKPDPLTIALEAAREAGDLLLQYLDRPLNITQKARRADLVTDADRAAEKSIVERLRREFPQSSILGEESGLTCGTSDERWIVDPLDGTTNFAHGYPLFCVSIAYERAGELIAGVVFVPFMGECFAAEKGSGATCNDKRLTVSTVEMVGDALTCTGFHPADYERNAEYFGRMSHHAQGVRRDGSAALDLAYIAAGRFDGFWEYDLHAWDIAAGTLLITEAGGTVSRIDGGPGRLEAGSILATNGRIHAQMRAILTS